MTIKKPDRIPINTRFMLGFEIMLPAIPEAMKLTPSEADDWAEERIKEAGYKPLAYCHMRTVYGDNKALAIMVSTYVYRKEARDDKAEFHPAGGSSRPK